jgi:hypothetical protein
MSSRSMPLPGLIALAACGRSSSPVLTASELSICDGRTVALAAVIPPASPAASSHG